MFDITLRVFVGVEHKVSISLSVIVRIHAGSEGRASGEYIGNYYSSKKHDCLCHQTEVRASLGLNDVIG